MNLPETLTNPIEVKNQLQVLADELDLPIEDERVLDIWSKEPHPHTEEVWDKVFKPLYFSK